MKDQGMITEKYYMELIKKKNPTVRWTGHGMDQEGYFTCSDSSCDIMYPREYIQNVMKEEKHTNASARHRRSLYMFTSNGGTITIRTNKSIPSVWKTAVTAAITEWNNLGYKVKFAGLSGNTDTSINGYLNIEYGDTGKGNENIAATNPVTSAGSYATIIRINNKFYNNPNNPITASARKFVMVHEIGHAIGLLHTNATISSANGVYDVNSQIKCNGTVNYIDLISVMRATIQPNTLWGGFTPCDKAVIDYYW